METERAINVLRMMHLECENYTAKEAIRMAISALKRKKMTNREYLIKLLEDGDEKIVQYLNCSACEYEGCSTGVHCALGVLKFLDAEMEICDDLSDFRPTREDVEKAFEMYKKDRFQKTCDNCKNAWVDCAPRDDRSCFSWEEKEVEQCQPKE